MLTKTAQLQVCQPALAKEHSSNFNLGSIFSLSILAAQSLKWPCSPFAAQSPKPSSYAVSESHNTADAPVQRLSLMVTLWESSGTYESEGIQSCLEEAACGELCSVRQHYLVPLRLSHSRCTVRGLGSRAGSPGLLTTMKTGAWPSSLPATRQRAPPTSPPAGLQLWSRTATARFSRSRCGASNSHVATPGSSAPTEGKQYTLRPCPTNSKPQVLGPQLLGPLNPNP